MTQASVFFNNRTQAVRLPADMRFADDIKHVHIRKVGNERILTPISNVWDSFFIAKDPVSDDVMAQRSNAPISQRESFD